MRPIESVKCSMIHEDLSTVIDGVEFEDARLMHEHHFVPAKKGKMILLFVVSPVAIVIVAFVVN